MKMKMKIASLIAALLLATSLTHAAEVIKSLPAGFSILGNPLNRGDNSLNTILPDVPMGTLVYRYRADTGYTACQQTQIGWLPNLSFAPGEGFFIFLPTAQTITFSGEPSQGAVTISLQGGNTFHLVASAVDMALPIGRLGQGVTLNFPAVGGDVLYIFADGAYVVYTYDARRGWIDADDNDAGDGPMIPVGGGFFVRKSGFTRMWVQTPAN